MRLALDYAEVPFALIYDEEVLAGTLDEYDWLHLHHEDFTGQYGKFYASYRNSEWYQTRVETSEALARKLGFAKVSELKKAVVRKIKDYVARGGFLFAIEACLFLFNFLYEVLNDCRICVFNKNPYGMR